MALRPGVALVLQGCDAQYLALCTVGTLPAGCEDRYLKRCRAAPSALLEGACPYPYPYPYLYP